MTARTVPSAMPAIIDMTVNTTVSAPPQYLGSQQVGATTSHPNLRLVAIPRRGAASTQQDRGGFPDRMSKRNNRNRFLEGDSTEVPSMRPRYHVSWWSPH